MNPEELITKYFNKTLSKAEENTFTSLLNTDAHFKALFEEHKNMQVAFKINEKAKLKEFLNTLETPKKPFIKTFLNQKTIVLAAACCLVLGVFYFFNSNNTPLNIYDNYFEVYPNVLEPVVRGKTSTNSEAFKAYENKSYLKAEKLFETTLKLKPNSNIEFYYAMSLLNQDKLHEAQNVLNDIKLKTHDFEAEVFWYSALIAIKQNDFISAKKELHALNQLKSDFKKLESNRLLKRLE